MLNLFICWYGVHDLKFVMIDFVSRKISHQRVAKLPPISSQSPDANRDHIKKIPVVVTTAWIGLGCAGFLKFDLWFCPVANSLYFHAY